MSDLFGGIFDDLSKLWDGVGDDIDGAFDTVSDFLGFNKGSSKGGGTVGKDIKLDNSALGSYNSFESATSTGLGSVGREIADAAKTSPVAAVNPSELYNNWRYQLNNIKSMVQSTK